MLKCCICVFALLTWSIAIKWKLPQNGIFEPVATSPISVVFVPCETACICLCLCFTLSIYSESCALTWQGDVINMADRVEVAHDLLRGVGRGLHDVHKQAGSTRATRGIQRKKCDTTVIYCCCTVCRSTLCNSYGFLSSKILYYLTF